MKEGESVPGGGTAIRVGEVIAVNLSPEEKARIDAEVAKATAGGLKELAEIKKRRWRVSPSFYQPMTF